MYSDTEDREIHIFRSETLRVWGCEVFPPTQIFWEYPSSRTVLGESHQTQELKATFTDRLVVDKKS